MAGEAWAGPRPAPLLRISSASYLYGIAVFAIVLSRLSPTHCTITVPARSDPLFRRYGQQRSFPSQPAMFGVPISPGVELDAHLQGVEGDEHLCGGELEYEGEGILELSRAGAAVTGGSAGGTSDRGGKVVIPTDGRPVALLAKRGVCSFERKARVAQYLSQRAEDVVRYVLVYDDQYSPTLVPMSATDVSGIEVSLLFVSFDTGIALNQILYEQPDNATTSGGTILSLNANGPLLPPGYEDPKEWMLAALAGFFLVLACFGCLLMCAQSRFVFVDDNNVIHIGRRAVVEANRQNDADDAPLLTEGQVLSLPEIEYWAINEDTAAAYEKRAEDVGSTRIKRRQGRGGGGGGLRNSPDPVESIVSIPRSLLGRRLSLGPNSVCSICIEEYEAREKVRVLPCGHIFHTECILPWLTERVPCCPVCKAAVIADDALSEGGGRSAGSVSVSIGSDIERDQDMGASGLLSLWWSRWRSGQDPERVADGEQGEVSDALQTPLLQDPRSPPTSRRPSGTSAGPSRSVVEGGRNPEENSGS